MLRCDVTGGGGQGKGGRGGDDESESEEVAIGMSKQREDESSEKTGGGGGEGKAASGGGGVVDDTNGRGPWISPGEDPANAVSSTIISNGSFRGEATAASFNVGLQEKGKEDKAAAAIEETDHYEIVEVA